MTMPELYLTTEEDLPKEEDYVRVMLAWTEVQVLTFALHHYCFKVSPEYRELTPEIGKHAYSLHRIMIPYRDSIVLADLDGKHYPTALFPVYFTVCSYHVLTELLCLYVDPSSAGWLLKVNQSIEKKLEEMRLAVAVLGSGVALQQAS